MNQFQFLALNQFVIHNQETDFIVSNIYSQSCLHFCNCWNCYLPLFYWKQEKTSKHVRPKNQTHSEFNGVTKQSVRIARCSDVFLVLRRFVWVWFSNVFLFLVFESNISSNSFLQSINLFRFYTFFFFQLFFSKKL